MNGAAGEREGIQHGARRQISSARSVPHWAATAGTGPSWPLSRNGFSSCSVCAAPKTKSKSSTVEAQGDVPSHPLPVGLQLLQRRTRHAHECDVACDEVLNRVVERVRHRGADRAASGIREAEHEVIDQQLGAPVEQLGERLCAYLRVEAVLLCDRPHGSSRRCLASSSLARVRSFSRASSSFREASCCSRVPVLDSVTARQHIARRAVSRIANRALRRGFR